MTSHPPSYDGAAHAPQKIPRSRAVLIGISVAELEAITKRRPGRTPATTNPPKRGTHMKTNKKTIKVVQKTSGLKVRSYVKAGGFGGNHNRALLA